MHAAEVALACCHPNVHTLSPQDHDKLGKRGNLVQVKAGYARYTLFPQGIADYAIQSVMKNLWVSCGYRCTRLASHWVEQSSSHMPDGALRGHHAPVAGTLHPWIWLWLRLVLTGLWVKVMGEWPTYCTC